MSIFSAIKNAIFGKAKPKTQDVVPAPVTHHTETPTAPEVAPVEVAVVSQSVNIEAILTEAEHAQGHPSNWRTSIVDLMKLLDLDSSLANRKELADELGYTGDKDGSAEMNIWLHKAVMKKLADNGGTVPDSLKD
jgi:hypothetical protein